MEELGYWLLDVIGAFLTWAEPYLTRGVEIIESGSPFVALITVPAGVALGLTPASYPMVPAVVGYAAGGRTSARRRAALSLAFSGGIITVYALLGIVFATLGLTLMALLNRSIWLPFAVLAPFFWIMGLRLLGVLRFGMFTLRTPDPERARGGGMLGAYLLGLPFGLAGCPSCALVLPSVLIAIAASGSPITGLLAMGGLGIGQGIVLVAAGTFIGGLAQIKRLVPYRIFVEKTLGLILILCAAYFTWRALIWL
ncbi:Cytochrome C biogenesis protein transmembrane region (plasmid) [Rubrobacter radiotolerans]|uniref:Cytochrome C biogenesis protein transmembrane region n=1 Tax=Rubrobacter radiotolerans TaxID=42256 RepID=A0A023X7E9_RUBRA|nr:cytochrome c biogenesis protein CcdA [Rubrobacter radiotolerans]AHY48362.1 Cytochrome C biogenesis protein transmembrane region [Rubrobacter radiotolerans]MDX5895499.1 cytochrome c biogenesis protein CcdA [Rubrobacter radiotolerans]SMC01561.1 Cytochrome C biogenesis protein transmembrane region [Rubrobacter radiotolerans DSM 5868]